MRNLASSVFSRTVSTGRRLRYAPKGSASTTVTLRTLPVAELWPNHRDTPSLDGYDAALRPAPSARLCAGGIRWGSLVPIGLPTQNPPPARV